MVQSEGFTPTLGQFCEPIDTKAMMPSVRSLASGMTTARKWTPVSRRPVAEESQPPADPARFRRLKVPDPLRMPSRHRVGKAEVP